MVILTAYVLVSFSCTRTIYGGSDVEWNFDYNDDTVLVNKFAYAKKVLSVLTA